MKNFTKSLLTFLSIVLCFISLACSGPTIKSNINQGPTGLSMVNLNIENMCDDLVSYTIEVNDEIMYQGTLIPNKIKTVVLTEENYNFCFNENCSEVRIKEGNNVGFSSNCVRYGIYWGQNE